MRGKEGEGWKVAKVSTRKLGSLILFFMAIRCRGRQKNSWGERKGCQSSKISISSRQSTDEGVSGFHSVEELKRTTVPRHLPSLQSLSPPFPRYSPINVGDISLYRINELRHVTPRTQLRWYGRAAITAPEILSRMIAYTVWMTFNCRQLFSARLLLTEYRRRSDISR